jgi:hypothetical protein
MSSSPAPPPAYTDTNFGAQVPSAPPPPFSSTEPPPYRHESPQAIELSDISLSPEISQPVIGPTVHLPPTIASHADAVAPASVELTSNPLFRAAAAAPQAPVVYVFKSPVPLTVLNPPPPAALPSAAAVEASVEAEVAGYVHVGLS